ncbi:TetR/AcrR family transcriptional regulator [Nocardia sp. CDC159]|uniref:TetR/AcrR family transcriptional regulator n=1 Tax=Nocardia pulmonis TaxID=2951408 RepID=A0A9X2E4J6_9NOCA|nr:MULTISPECIES: TetR/AcrR family transcriptional regulator [Nocardia]MCM6774104.1 TetR/AcrR family transcriptional regulator [Nocardia pulmonis]MCM6786991.1 TetR/AcrR family transcriptional regulator [Nocardia sp. CDC159]
MSPTEDARRGPGRPRSDLARTAIMDAAWDLVQETPLADITVQAISERSGISKPTIYRWWPNRSAVVIEAAFDRFERMVPVDPHRADAEVRPAAEVLRELLGHLAAIMRGRPGRILADILAAGQSDPVVLTAFQDRALRPRHSEIRALFERGVAAGEFAADLDIDAAIDLALGPLYFRLLAQHQPLTDDACETLVDMTLRALRPTGGGVGASGPASDPGEASPRRRGAPPDPAVPQP